MVSCCMCCTVEEVFAHTPSRSLTPLHSRSCLFTLAHTSSRALHWDINIIWLCGCCSFPVSLVTALYHFCWHISASATCSVLLQRLVLLLCCRMPAEQDTCQGCSLSPRCCQPHPVPVPQGTLSADRNALHALQSGSKMEKL